MLQRPKAQPKQKQEKASDTAEERTKLEQAIADFVKLQEMQTRQKRSGSGIGEGGSTKKIRRSRFGAIAT